MSFKGETVLDHISSLSSAEDIFTYLLLPFRQDVLNVSRLHIMRRMGEYLRSADFAGLDDDAAFLEARATLKRAYMDFVDSTPLQEKVFKVFKDEQAKHQARFVAVDSLQLAAE